MSYSCSLAGRIDSRFTWGPNRSCSTNCPQTQATAPAAHRSRAAAGSCSRIAVTVPVRSPTRSLRNSSPFLRRRSSALRTISAWDTKIPSCSSRTCTASEDRVALGRHLMRKTALITGGTGGLGTAVTARLLDDGWRVVVPWIVESELERVQQRERLELVRADLFDPTAVGEAV